MSHLIVLMVASVVWIVWALAAALEKSARGESGGVSILPIIPLYPLLGWAVAYAFERFGMPLVVQVLLGLHLILLIAMVVSIGKSVLTIRRAEGD